MKFEAFFSGIKDANKAVDSLKSEGISAYTDINDHTQVNTDTRAKEISFLPTSSNSDLVLNSRTSSGNTDRAPLLAASPMVSGFGDFEEIADINYKVVVTVDPSNAANAEKILKSYGGSMQNPNFNVSEHIKNVDPSRVDPKIIEELE